MNPIDVLKNNFIKYFCLITAFICMDCFFYIFYKKHNYIDSYYSLSLHIIGSYIAAAIVTVLMSWYEYRN